MQTNGIKVGGGVVFWSLSQWFNRESLKAGLVQLGLPELLPPERPLTQCLRSAMASSFKGHIIRNLSRPTDIEAVRVDPGENANTYTQVLVGRVDVDSAQVRIRPFDQDVANKIVGEFNLARGLVSGDAVSDMLIRYLDRQAGTRLRPSGGIYWLPDDRLPAWQALTSVVENCAARGGCACHLLRHITDGDAVRAVKAAITEEIEAEAKKLFEEVTSGELGERALQHREEVARDLADKVRLFEQLLSVSLDSLRKSCEDAEAAAAAAAIQVGAGAVA